MQLACACILWTAQENRLVDITSVSMYLVCLMWSFVFLVIEEELQQMTNSTKMDDLTKELAKCFERNIINTNSSFEFSVCGGCLV